MEPKIIHFLHALRLHRGGRSARHAEVDAAAAGSSHRLFQVSTLNAIMEGVFDGTMTMSRLRAHGDFGVGTFNGLDGELVAVDGDFYQLRSDGSAHLVDDDMRTPFAVVLRFRPEVTTDLQGPAAIEDLGAHLHEVAGSGNYFFAIRLDGTFSRITVRAVPRQEKPYPTLVEATEHQSVFDFDDVDGTIVGFRFPDFSQGINMAGLHLHFIAADRRHGGHVLDFVLESGAVSIDHTADFFLELPETDEFEDADLAKDEREDIKRAEGPGERAGDSNQWTEGSD
jgi:acetolactate decarboxylase